jgi:hypothetical protein
MLEQADRRAEAIEALERALSLYEQKGISSLRSGPAEGWPTWGRDNAIPGYRRTYTARHIRLGAFVPGRADGPSLVAQA